MYHKILLLLFPLFLSACQHNYFNDFYNDEMQDENLYQKRTNEDVKVIDTFNLKQTMEKYQKDYILIGSSFFHDHWCSRSLAVETAKEKGATLVIIESIPTDSNVETYAIAIPQTNTIYHNGSISGTSVSNGGWGSTSNINASFHGTSTYYTTQTIYDTKNNYYFSQKAFFMAKKKEPLKND